MVCSTGKVPLLVGRRILEMFFDNEMISFKNIQYNTVNILQEFQTKMYLKWSFVFSYFALHRLWLVTSQTQIVMLRLQAGVK